MDVSLKAASVLGVEVSDGGFDVISTGSMADLAGKLQRCIRSLIKAMEGDGREEILVSADQDASVGEPMMLIRTLEEVVRGCERECFRSCP
jgi:hypothetical protein